MPCSAAARYADEDEEEPGLNELIEEDQAQQLAADGGGTRRLLPQHPARRHTNAAVSAMAVATKEEVTQ